MLFASILIAAGDTNLLCTKGGSECKGKKCVSLTIDQNIDANKANITTFSYRAQTPETKGVCIDTVGNTDACVSDPAVLLKSSDGGGASITGSACDDTHYCKVTVTQGKGLKAVYTNPTYSGKCTALPDPTGGGDAKKCINPVVWGSAGTPNEKITGFCKGSYTCDTTFDKVTPAEMKADSYGKCTKPAPSPVTCSKSNKCASGECVSLIVDKDNIKKEGVKSFSYETKSVGDSTGVCFTKLEPSTGPCFSDPNVLVVDQPPTFDGAACADDYYCKVIGGTGTCTKLPDPTGDGDAKKCTNPVVWKTTADSPNEKITGFCKGSYTCDTTFDKVTPAEMKADSYGNCTSTTTTSASTTTKDKSGSVPALVLGVVGIISSMFL